MSTSRPPLVVWIDGWQMQCCGEPFAVGSRVTWALRPAGDPDFAESVLGRDVAATVTHHEHHHDPEPEQVQRTTGTVRSIRAASCVYAPRGNDRNSYHPVPGTATLVQKTAADGTEPRDATTTFVAYLVELDA